MILIMKYGDIYIERDVRRDENLIEEKDEREEKRKDEKNERIIAVLIYGEADERQMGT